MYPENIQHNSNNTVFKLLKLHIENLYSVKFSKQLLQSVDF